MPLRCLSSLNPKKLRISNADITSRDVPHIIESCVETLVFDNCYGLTDDLIIDFAKGLGTRLKGLFIVASREGTESQISDTRYN